LETPGLVKTEPIARASLYRIAHSGGFYPAAISGFAMFRLYIYVYVLSPLGNRARTLAAGGSGMSEMLINLITAKTHLMQINASPLGA
jgi:hypothetical protein